MNAKTMVVLQVQKNDNIFSFHMPAGVNYGEAYDAAFAVLEDILALSKQAVESARRNEEENKSAS